MLETLEKCGSDFVNFKHKGQTYHLFNDTAIITTATLNKLKKHDTGKLKKYNKYLFTTIRKHMSNHLLSDWNDSVMDPTFDGRRLLKALDDRYSPNEERRVGRAKKDFVMVNIATYKLT